MILKNYEQVPVLLATPDYMKLLERKSGLKQTITHTHLWSLIAFAASFITETFIVDFE